MKVVLELQDQPSNVRRITVRHDIVIGRGSDCNLRLSAPQVSRRHCFLRVGRDSVSVTDLNSSNGTFIDGTRITAGKRYDIDNGAQLALGPIRFIIHVRSDVAVAQTAKSGSAPESKRSKVGHDAVAAYAAEDSSTINARIQTGEAKPQMDYAVEQGGESAEPHEPTADYLDDQFSANRSANLFSDVPDPADSRIGIAGFGKRPAEQSESTQETNDFPDADIVGNSAAVNLRPQWDSNILDPAGSPQHIEATNADNDVESAWLSADDDEISLPQPVNLGNAYVGESSHDAFNDVDAGVIEGVEEVEEVVEVEDALDEIVISETEDVLHVEDAAQLRDENDIEIEEVAVIEEAAADAEAIEVQDWLNFDEVAEVQEALDVEEVIEVKDALDEVVVSEAEDVLHVEDAAQLRDENDIEIEEVAVLEEATAEAESSEVQDWLNFDEVVEVQETLDGEEVVEVEDVLDEVVISESEDVLNAEQAAELQGENEIEEATADAEASEVQDWLNLGEVQEALDVEEVVEIEDALDEVVVSETEEVLNIEDAIEFVPEADDEVLAEVEYFSDDAAMGEAEELLELDHVEQIQESMKIDAATAELPAAGDDLQIAVEEGSDSNWFANDKVSESDAFFDNFISPELETEDRHSAEAAERDDEIDPDLQNFLKGF